MAYKSGSIFIREGELKAGESTQTHRHNFDHVTYVPMGAIRYERLDEPTRQDGRYVDGDVLASVVVRASEKKNWVLVEKGVIHRLVGLEDSRYHCIYSHRNSDGEVVEEYTGWEEAYR